MNKKNLLFVLGTGLLIVIILGSLLLLRQFGAQYGNALLNLAPTPNPAPQTREAKKIRRIRVTKSDGSCLEMTPDGVVRTYAVCDGELTDANRLADPKNILRLFELTSQYDFEKLKVKPAGTSIMLTVETDTGTQVIYIPTGSGGGGDDVGHTIDQIEGDLPQPTQTPGPGTPNPTPTQYVFNPSETVTISPILPPGVTPTMPVPTIEQQFSCGFAADPSGKKPYNISNYICTTEPTPAP